MEIQITTIQPSYKKDSGLYVLDIEAIALPFTVTEKYLVYLPPEKSGGNHSHPRKEAFIGIGEGMLLIWLDENNTKNTFHMNPDGVLNLCIISPHVPHAVHNSSKDHFGILLEYADKPQHDCVSVKVI